MVFCQNCGNKLEKNSGYCSKCGEKIGSSIHNAHESSRYQYLNNHYAKVFMRFDDKIRKHKHENKPGLPNLLSWNWAAFFFGWFWLIYKKCWIPFIILTILSAISTIFLITHPERLWSFWDTMVVSFTFFVGMWGDSWVYQLHHIGKLVNTRRDMEELKEKV